MSRMGRVSSLRVSVDSRWGYAIEVVACMREVFQRTCTTAVQLLCLGCHLSLIRCFKRHGASAAFILCVACAFNRTAAASLHSCTALHACVHCTD